MLFQLGVPSFLMIWRVSPVISHSHTLHQGSEDVLKVRGNSWVFQCSRGACAPNGGPRLFLKAVSEKDVSKE